MVARSSSALRWFAVLSCVASLAIACGSSGGNGSGQDSPDSGDPGTPGLGSGGGGAGSCAPRSCADQAIECGPAGDGCGAIIQCGACGDGLRCGGPGAPSKCVSGVGTGTCSPKSCADLGIGCGPSG